MLTGYDRFHRVHAGEDDVQHDHEAQPDDEERVDVHRGKRRIGGKDRIDQPLEATGLVHAGRQRHRKAELQESRPGKRAVEILERAHADARQSIRKMVTNTM